MKIISTTNARKKIASVLRHIKTTGEAFVIGKHNQPEAILIKYPDVYNDVVSDITNINAYSESFSFLEDEPDLYSASDLKKCDV